MHELQEKLELPTILPLSYAKYCYNLDTGACKDQVRSLLSQKQRSDITKLDDYCTRSSSESEQASDTAEIQCLALFWIAFMLRFY